MELFMIKNKSLLAFCTGISLIAISTALPAQEIPDGAEESLLEARELCNGISESNKRLAKSAGYDIEKLCSSLKLFELPKADSRDEPLVLPRKQAETVAETTQLPQSPGVIKTSETVESSKLRAFGYDLFAGEPISFEPASRIPVSPNYVLGPGDTVKVLFYGKINESHDLEINRDGSIEFPQLGPVSLAGMTFSNAKKLFSNGLKKK